jgi:hypothetical protein
VGKVLLILGGVDFHPFLKFTGRSDLAEAAGLAGVKRSHSILPVLSDDDERLVVHACASGAVSARDAAIILLALTTGLRACDIIGLSLGEDPRAVVVGASANPSFATPSPTQTVTSSVSPTLCPFLIDINLRLGGPSQVCGRLPPYEPAINRISAPEVVAPKVRGKHTQDHHLLKR